MDKKSRFAPIVIAVSVVIGMLLGMFFANRFTGSKLNIVNTTSNH